MFQICKQFIAAFVSLSLVAPSVSYATGSVAGATEVTQLANNVQLVAQQAQMVLSYKKQIEQFLTQIRQYQRQLQDAISVNSLAKAAGIQGLLNDLNKVRETKKAFEKLYGSMDRLGANWQQRFLEASSAGLSLEQYAKREIDRIKQGSDSAIKRVEQERRLIDAVEEDYSLAKKWGDQIDNQEGLQASLGLLNTQMNRLLHQNARVNQLLAQAYGSDKALEEQNKAEVAAKNMQATTDQGINQRSQYDEMSKFFKEDAAPNGKERKTHFNFK